MPVAESTATRGLSISVTESEAETLVCVSGRVSVDFSPELRNRLLAILDRKSPSKLTIDLADANYIDCSGIATLVEALGIAHIRKTILQLRGLRDRPRYLLEVTGLLSLFKTNGPIIGSSASEVL